MKCKSNYSWCLLNVLYFINWIFAFDKSNNKLEIFNSNTSSLRKNTMIDTMDLKIDEAQLNQDCNEKDQMKTSRTRIKRQSGAGKFTDAAKMPQVKVMRLLLQMFKNLWSSVYVGGTNPFHPEVPKPIVYLFKDKVYEFFFPDVGDVRQKKARKH